MRILIVGTVLLSVFGSGSLSSVNPLVTRNLQGARESSGYPVTDNTRKLGPSLPGGEQRVQSVGFAARGSSDAVGVPTCLDFGIWSAEPSCIDLCVTMPRGSRVIRVQAFAHGPASTEWTACDRKSCIANAAYDGVGPRESTSDRGLRSCWVFRNWDNSDTRHALLVATFRPPQR